MKKRRFYTTRAFFAVVALLYIIWFLFSNPSFYDYYAEVKVQCVSVVSPGYGQRSGEIVEFDNDSVSAYNQYLESQRDGNRTINNVDLKQTWAQGCEVARMSRQTHIILASLLATIIFFSIPPRQKGNTGNRDQGETVDSEQPSQDT
ncbi:MULTISPECIES: hypothetical protein [unclassified Actinobaculum]|uniref:hypothetical protein n=1 Tax=unclassified Actinobaculum TaxID=2609299 RepID=UPI000D526FBD|nr:MULTISPECIES: hypothetical protein [unclassified Actinobaculum]AWE43090.1 hypothetical protein DDD63_10460 [Actinobaculum sp. 313]RTE48524.1 hypothetical protein EKN07_09155 [Actinobaculum sp. 352]